MLNLNLFDKLKSFFLYIDIHKLANIKSGQANGGWTTLAVIPPKFLFFLVKDYIN